jgi:hypothetical protein
MKWYLAGPMNGIPQYNIPAFDAAAAHLRAAGHEVVSPAELDSPAVREAALASMDGLAGTNIAGETWGDMLARDVKLISDVVGGIIFLPTWDRSRGARLEAFVGLLTGKVFAYYDRSNGTGIYHISAGTVRRVLRENMP